MFCRMMRRLPEQREPAHMRDVQQHQLALHRLCSTAHGHREGRVGRLGDGFVPSAQGRESARALVQQRTTVAIVAADADAARTRARVRVAPGTLSGRRMIRMWELRVKPGGFQMLGWRCKRWMDGVEDPPTSLKLGLKGRLVLLTSATLPRLRHYAFGHRHGRSTMQLSAEAQYTAPEILNKPAKVAGVRGERPRASATDKTLES